MPTLSLPAPADLLPLVHALPPASPTTDTDSQHAEGEAAPAQPPHMSPVAMHVLQLIGTTLALVEQARVPPAPEASSDRGPAPIEAETEQQSTQQPEEREIADGEEFGEMPLEGTPSSTGR